MKNCLYLLIHHLRPKNSNKIIFQVFFPTPGTDFLFAKRGHFAPVLRDLRTRLSPCRGPAVGGWAETGGADTPEAPRITCRRQGSSGSARPGLVSARIPGESLSSPGSNAASSTMISSVDVGGFAQEVPPPVSQRERATDVADVLLLTAHGVRSGCKTAWHPPRGRSQASRSSLDVSV